MILSTLSTLHHHAPVEKIIVFHKKRRKRYQKKNGHRQPFTEIRVTEIVGG